MAIQNPDRWIITNETDQLELIDQENKVSYGLTDPVKVSDILTRINDVEMQDEINIIF